MGQVGYYDEDFEPWVRSIRSIGSAIVQAPLVRAQAQERERLAQLNTARIATEGQQQQHYAAGTRKLDAETAALVKKGQLVTALEQSAAQAQQDIAAGNTDTPAVRTFSGAASALTGVNGDDIVKAARQGIGTLLGRMGKVTEAAAVENPVELEKARIGAAKGVVLQPGAALLGADGQPIYTNPSAAAQAAGEYEETSTEYPAVEATEGTPAIPAKTHWFRADEPAIPAVPGTPYQPKRVVKTRRKLGDGVANAPFAPQSQDPDDSEEAEGILPPLTAPEVPASARAAGGKQLDAATAKAILDEVGGDKNQARELARQRGYTF